MILSLLHVSCLFFIQRKLELLNYECLCIYVKFKCTKIYTWRVKRKYEIFNYVLLYLKNEVNLYLSSIFFSHVYKNLILLIKNSLDK